MTTDAQPAGLSVNFKPIDMQESAQAERVRWAPTVANTLLVALPESRRSVRIVGVSMQGQTLPLASLPAKEDWDVGATQSRQAQLVHTESGSAVLGLAWRTLPDGKPEKVNQHRALGIFGQPRYVRGAQGSPLPLTSVALLGQPRQTKVVVFRPDANGGYQAHQVLPTPAGQHVQGVLMLQAPGGYLMLLHLANPAAPRRGDMAAGTLLAQPLNDKFMPSGPAWQPLGDRPVYEFDADMAGTRLVLLATTPQGWAVADGEQVSTGEAGLLSSPALAVDKGTIRLAVVSKDDDKGQRLLAAHVSLPQH